MTAATAPTVNCDRDAATGATSRLSQPVTAAMGFSSVSGLGAPPLLSAVDRSARIRSYTSSRCTAMSGGAAKPSRTWLPFMPSTVTVTSSPMITDSPGRLLRMSMAIPLDLVHPRARLEWLVHRGHAPSRQRANVAPMRKEYSTIRSTLAPRPRDALRRLLYPSRRPGRGMGIAKRLIAPEEVALRERRRRAKHHKGYLAACFPTQHTHRLCTGYAHTRE
jgi:hypothetical protein